MGFFYPRMTTFQRTNTWNQYAVATESHLSKHSLSPENLNTGKNKEAIPSEEKIQKLAKENKLGDGWGREVFEKMKRNEQTW